MTAVRGAEHSGKETCGVSQLLGLSYLTGVGSVTGLGVESYQ